MNIGERKLNDITVLDLNGNLAREGNEQFRNQIFKITNAGVQKLVLNLAAVPHMDSRGVCELIYCYKAMQEVDGRIILLNPNRRLQNLLVITRLITLFETFDTESAAIASFTCSDRDEPHHAIIA